MVEKRLAVDQKIGCDDIEHPEAEARSPQIQEQTHPAAPPIRPVKAIKGKGHAQDHQSQDDRCCDLDLYPDFR